LEKSTVIDIENSPLPLVETDKDFGILGYSNAVLHFFEISKNQTISHLTDLLGDISELILPKDKKQRIFSETIPVISRKGESRWIRTTFYPIGEKFGNYQIYFDDVT
jgi:hypothetical protein